MNTWVDGIPCEQVSVFDRGLQFGDGLFETMRIVDADVPLLDRHIQRLSAGCERLGIAMPDEDILRREVNCVASLHTNGVLKLIVNRGDSRRGYRCPQDSHSKRVMYYSELPVYPREFTARICRMPLSQNKTLAGIKHLNRLEQVLARREWDDPEIHEGIMLDVDGMVIEGISSNIFLLHQGLLLTPKLDRSGVTGIMRQLLMEIAQQQGLRCEISTVNKEALISADAVFLTNSLMGMRPVSRIIGLRDYSAPGREYQKINRLICNYFKEKI
ncbi:MAG: aminodeoxychorismate lyase [Gammaproteobacteria bacterium]|nr:aminodeoxychorismate lyase [Gammaproteobacteria bacterium]